MFNLHVIQAEFGDAMIIEYGTAKSKFILLDGGPSGVYDHFLRAELLRITGAKPVLEALMVSHIDIDHIKGILDLLAELKSQKDSNKPLFVNIKEIWLNNFSDTIDTDGTISNRIQMIYSNAQSAGIQMSSTGIAVNGVKEGHKLRTFANILKIPMNKTGKNGMYKVGAPSKVTFGNLKFTIVGPTQENLDELKKEWEAWLAKQDDAINAGNFNLLAMSDKSVPNLSSIMFLVEGDGKTILFTGDGRGDHLLDGLTAKKLLKNGKLHVDIFKVAHHGSDRNTDKSFFEKITADKYVISANGKHGNPDYNTLLWIVETAKAAKRKIELLMTNETESTIKLLKERPMAKWGYKLNYLPKNNNSVKIVP